MSNDNIIWSKLGQWKPTSQLAQSVVDLEMKGFCVNFSSIIFTKWSVCVQAYVENLEKEVRRLVDENLKLKKQCKEVHAKTYWKSCMSKSMPCFLWWSMWWTLFSSFFFFFFFCCTAETGSSGTRPPNQELTSKNLIHPILKGQRNKHGHIYLIVVQS